MSKPGFQKLSAPEQLIALCVRLRWGDSDTILARELSRSGCVDWNEFVHLAVDHRVAPLIYCTLKEQPGLVPTHVLRSLHDEYVRAALNNSLLLEGLGIILSTFAAERIEVVLLKGAALAQNLYSNIALRPMGDLDLWVQPQDLSAAVTAMMSLGYEISEKLEEHRPGAEAAFGYVITFSREKPWPILVELHWRPRHPFEYGSRLSDAWLWSQTEAAMVSEHPVRLLKPEAQALYLSLHLCNHYPHLWGWLCDIRELFDKEKINTDYLIQSAEQFRAILALQLVLGECQALFPSEQLSAVLDRLAKSPISLAERSLFRLSLLGPRNRFATVLVGLMMLPDWASRFRFISGRAFPSQEYLHRRYNIPAKVPLALIYLYRPFEGLISWVRARF